VVTRAGRRTGRCRTHATHSRAAVLALLAIAEQDGIDVGVRVIARGSHAATETESSLDDDDTARTRIPRPPRTGLGRPDHPSVRILPANMNVRCNEREKNIKRL
jgi:hypothetical protein